jgi:hypothetical protein
MTRIEERLGDALHASAGRVRDDKLRPLPDPEAAAEHRAGRRQVRRAWLIPAAAAASVVLVVGLVLAATGGLRSVPRPSGSGSPGTTAGGLPRYFVRIAGTGPSNRVEVQSVSTGAVVATVRPPKPPLGGVINYDAVAAAPDDRTFYVEYDVFTKNFRPQIWILTFSITASGSATPLTMIKGGLLDNQPGGLETWGNLAVSPDGTKLALTVNNLNRVPALSPGYNDKIIVIDLRTGQRTEWQGGLYRTGKVFSIPDLSWAADGQSLVFLGQWCDSAGQSTSCLGTPGAGGYRDAQVWSLSTATVGGPLTRGRLLLRESARYPVIAQAYGGPDSSDITVVVLSGRVNNNGQWQWPLLAVETVSAVNGSVLAVDYRILHNPGFGGSPQQVWLTADPGGRHLLVSYAVIHGIVIGWIGQGAFHPLPIPQPYLPTDATLVIAW